MNQLAPLRFTGENTFATAQLRAIPGQLVVLLLLVAWLYSSILLHLVFQWRDDANFSHGFLVPPFALFVLWHERKRLRGISIKPSSWGLAVIGFSLSVLVLGVLGAELFLARVSFVFLLAGLILLFFGAAHLRAALFPVSVLLLMIPIPAIVFDQMTFPLQIIASKLAAAALPVLGVPVLREGNIMKLPALSLQVAEACSGIRSLLSLITLTAVYGYVMKSRNWLRAALVVSAVPIAILANSLRIIVTGILGQYWSPQRAEGFFHTFSGWLVFLMSVLIVCLTERLLRFGYWEVRRCLAS